MPLVERTVLPPQDRGQLVGVLATLTTRRTRGAALVGPDGKRPDLPPEVFEVLCEVVEVLSRGMAITIAPHQMILSTSEAAGILGVSRPTLVRLLETGEIPFEQPARHRRVRLADVLAYPSHGVGPARYVRSSSTRICRHHLVDRRRGSVPAAVVR